MGLLENQRLARHSFELTKIFEKWHASEYDHLTGASSGDFSKRGVPDMDKACEILAFGAGVHVSGGLPPCNISAPGSIKVADAQVMLAKLFLRAVN